MAKPSSKIALSVSRDIPFNKLVLSQSNVRRVKAGIAIEELAEDIARRTLLQSLTVRPVLDDEGNETGMYEVVPDHTRRTLIDDVPFPCRPGRPAEFAHMAKALIENQMMNGSVVRIDGAVRMREPQARSTESAR